MLPLRPALVERVETRSLVVRLQAGRPGAHLTSGSMDGQELVALDCHDRRCGWLGRGRPVAPQHGPDRLAQAGRQLIQSRQSHVQAGACAQAK